MSDLNLITVCTDAYPIEYARKLIKRVKEVSSYNITAYCITDRPNDVVEFSMPILQHDSTVEGWWNKVQVFDGRCEVRGWTLYMDLDIIVQQSFDLEISSAQTKDTYGEAITCVSDSIGWMDNKFSSSWMMFKPENQHYIYKKFAADPERIQRYPGGDQVWIGKEVRPKYIDYIDEDYPNLKKNLKFHLGKKVFGEWQFPNKIDSNIKLVDCGGRPKPHKLRYLKYIRENWHNI